MREKDRAENENEKRDGLRVRKRKKKKERERERETHTHTHYIDRLVEQSNQQLVHPSSSLPAVTPAVTADLAVSAVPAQITVTSSSPRLGTNFCLTRTSPGFFFFLQPRDTFRFSHAF